MRADRENGVNKKDGVADSKRVAKQANNNLARHLTHTLVSYSVKPKR